MGEVVVTGEGALAYLQKMMTNDVSKLKDGQAQYTAMCYENGGTVDDLLIYKRGEDDYLLVVNASNIEKDFEWMNNHVTAMSKLKTNHLILCTTCISRTTSRRSITKINRRALNEIKFFRFKENVEIAGQNVLVSRTGYTGEDGFEIYGIT